MKLIGCLILSFCLAVASAKDYENYKVFDVTPEKAQIPELSKWEFKVGVDFLSKTKKTSKVLVSPDMEGKFVKFLTTNEILYEMVVGNVGVEVHKEKVARMKSSKLRKALDDNNNPNFELYWTFDEMEAYAIQISQMYPERVKLDQLGKSVEGRNMIGLRISSGSEFGNKPIIFIDSGTHAREWVGPHTVLYLIYQLVENSTSSLELLDKVDFVIVPNVNPDGYHYTHTEDRFWRKNRRPVNFTCAGIDLNRNYAYGWEYAPNSCQTSNYPGEHALSEPESSAVAAYMESFKNKMRMYLSVHSAGCQVIWPFGFEFDLYVRNWKEHQLVGELWQAAVLEATGVDYEVGNSADILYLANGASDEHAYSFANPNLSFTIELPYSDFNWHDYPQDMVYDLAKGTFLGFRALAMYVGDTYNYEF